MITVREFQKAFERLVKEGSSVWEQGFEPDSECNANALRYFRDWLEDHKKLFDDADDHQHWIDNCIEQIEGDDDDDQA